MFKSRTVMKIKLLDKVLINFILFILIVAIICTIMCIATNSGISFIILGYIDIIAYYYIYVYAKNKLITKS